MPVDQHLHARAEVRGRLLRRAPHRVHRAPVSHELRTPLARILALLDSADLPGADVPALIDQARAEVEHAGALIDEILFLSELESGKEIVSLGRTTALPVLEEARRASSQTGEPAPA